MPIEFAEVQKSRSDSEVSCHAINKFSSERLFIDDISSCESSAGDRVWILCSGLGDLAEPTNIHFIGPSFEEPALDINRRNEIVMFTVPLLQFEKECDIQVRVSLNNGKKTCVPFKYIPRTAHSSSNQITLFDNLMEFATNGDSISLLMPFLEHISKIDAEGNTVLHIASKSCQSFPLKLILSVIPEDQKEALINAQNNSGMTALQCAIRTGDPDAVHYLMNHGAKIDIADNHGCTALHYLGDAYNESIFKEILEPLRKQKFDVNRLNKEGFAPIHVAVRRLKLSLIEMLLEAGALIDILDRDKKRNSLMHAIEMNDFETIQLLIERGSNPNIEDDSNDTALSLAVKNINYPVIGLLLDNGADPNRQNGKGVCLADSEDSVIQNIINGERPELPKKEACSIPTDLATSRSPLFGRSYPGNAGDSSSRNRIVKKSRDEIISDAESLLEESDRGKSITTIRIEEFDSPEEEHPGPSTSTGRSRLAASDIEQRSKYSDNVCNLDYLTRIRVSKIFDDQAKWQTLAQQLQCEHMIEFISICSAGDESSPTMILLDQFEQLPDSSISKLREAMNEINEEEGVKLIDERYVY